MKNPFNSSPAKQGKKLAEDIAKQVAREPLEIGKSAIGQITGESKDLPVSQNQKTSGFQEQIFPSQNQASETGGEQKPEVNVQHRLGELENEIKKIVKEKLVRDIGEKIARGEEVSLENYPQLSLEEREMFSGQIQSVKIQKEIRGQQENALVEPQSKRPRNIFAFGRKPKSDTSLQAERQKRRIETPMPPTG